MFKCGCQQERILAKEASSYFKNRTNVPSVHTLSIEYKGGEWIGVIETDQWMEADFEDKRQITKSLLGYFKEEEDVEKVYSYLLMFGMYKPGRSNKKVFESLKEEDVWKKTEKIYKKYREKWKGIDIPIFIFPLDQGNLVLKREGNGKSGVSFADKLFLFLSAETDDKELEALFVHEYHHVCRMNGQQKNPKEYTLLDSLIFEGLAENAVAVHCGDNYTNDWTKKYSKELLKKYWEKEIKQNLSIKRNDPLHDQILFGFHFRPRLLGYAMGYELIQNYKKETPFSDNESFVLPSKEFLIHDFT